jgi:hypothetical protein
VILIGSSTGVIHVKTLTITSNHMEVDHEHHIVPRAYTPAVLKNEEEEEDEVEALQESLQI